jgi:hypothetical protein
MRMSVSGKRPHDSRRIFSAGSVSEPPFANRRLALTAQRHLEVRGKKAHLVALRFHQHVSQNRNRVFALNDP